MEEGKEERERMEMKVEWGIGGEKGRGIKNGGEREREMGKE